MIFLCQGRGYFYFNIASNRIYYVLFASKLQETKTVKRSILSTKSIILSKKPFGDGNLSIFLLTKELGVIRACAFGAARLSKRFKGGLDYFRTFDAEISIKESSECVFYEVSCVKKIHDIYSGISKRMDKFTAASYVSELTSMLLTPLEKKGSNNECYFDNLEACLQKIDLSIDTKEIMDEVYRYNVLMFEMTGFTPKLEYASSINSKLQQIEHLNAYILDRNPRSFSMLWSNYYDRSLEA